MRVSERERALDLLCEQAVFPYKSMERQAKLWDASGDKAGRIRNEATHTRTSHHDMLAQETAITCPVRYVVHVHTLTALFAVHCCHLGLKDGCEMELRILVLKWWQQYNTNICQITQILSTTVFLALLLQKMETIEVSKRDAVKKERDHWSTELVTEAR